MEEAAEAGIQDQKLLFNRWDMSEVEIKDPSLARYVNLHAMIVPHSCGKLAGQQFNKSNMLIVERLINKMMQTEHNTGKKELAIRIVKDALEIVNKKTKKNPVQVLVDAVENAGPREETVRLKYGGINVPKSVDTAPQRRVDTALRFITDGVRQASHKKKKTVSEALAEELIAAANGDTRSYAVSKREERERIAKAAR
ncbi:MAG TPA: 30S ribosomal protein S7 [Methanoculleus sp.]|jgi:small subunit ribosomal protein S7|uniref:30S ribosomal protein S7 n=1 Tax=Methanoculleus sp. TaxID=90427 RepID=UPI000B2B1BFA|nr:30S ribosomal protein S7 [Methanoculleus sp.]HNT08165.1 30S ribosomal protein S7 [Methanoculleus sp.]HOC84039.1 30S ribosomal protein S7 [Methanoculleus sp.]HOF95739.1 30S ribosomal protein S7 [Methanoculleus sp.]HOS67199.1 30S ribosomal protein S7 [Methanoculleus sp.]HOZ43385.1 30S ribosomal protein S7 [Methanoculleus sp.]